MDIDQLAQRLCLHRRQVRYTIDQRLVPGIAHVCQGRGIARKLTAEEVFVVACSAVLHSAGLRPTVVRGCLEELAPLLRQGSSSPGTVAIADGQDVQFYEDASQTNGRAPLVTTRLDLAGLRRRLVM